MRGGTGKYTFICFQGRFKTPGGCREDGGVQPRSSEKDGREKVYHDLMCKKVKALKVVYARDTAQPTSAGSWTCLMFNNHVVLLYKCFFHIDNVSFEES